MRRHPVYSEEDCFLILLKPDINLVLSLNGRELVVGPKCLGIQRIPVGGPHLLTYMPLPKDGPPAPLPRSIQVLEFPASASRVQVLQWSNATEEFEEATHEAALPYVEGALAGDFLHNMANYHFHPQWAHLVTHVQQVAPQFYTFETAKQRAQREGPSLGDTFKSLQEWQRVQNFPTLQDCLGELEWAFVHLLFAQEVDCLDKWKQGWELFTGTDQLEAELQSQVVQTMISHLNLLPQVDDPLLAASLLDRQLFIFQFAVRLLEIVPCHDLQAKIQEVFQISAEELDYFLVHLDY